MDKLLMLGYFVSACALAIFGAGFFAYNSLMGAVLGIQPGVFWPYLVGMCLFTLGLISIDKKELSQSTGPDKIIPFGRMFFAVPVAVFGTQHFTATKFVALMVPSWIPWHLFWAYFVGTCLIAAALSIVTGKQMRLAATLLGIMLLSFVLMMHIPTLLRNPGDRIQLAVVFRDLSFSGGAFALAATQTDSWLRYGTSRLITVARFFIAIPVILFGVENFLHPEFAPSVPLNKITPAWIPGHLYWGYAVGLIFVLAGFSMILRKNERRAAIWLGIVVLFIALFIYLPIVIAIPLDIANGLNYLVDTLLLCGTILLLANALPKENIAHIEKAPPTLKERATELAH